jgi:hypothetical protein
MAAFKTRDALTTHHPIVIAGLDPAIQLTREKGSMLPAFLDRRVKPGDDT